MILKPKPKMDIKERKLQTNMTHSHRNKTPYSIWNESHDLEASHDFMLEIGAKMKQASPNKIQTNSQLSCVDPLVLWLLKENLSPFEGW